MDDYELGAFEEREAHGMAAFELEGRAEAAEALLAEALELLGDFADDPAAGAFRARAEQHLRSAQGAH